MTGRVAYHVEVGEPKLLRRAWLTVGAALGIFTLIASIAAFASAWAYEHATVARSGSATVISGAGALWRESPDHEWSIFNESITIEEGDEISTQLGTVVWVTLFDGSTLEVTEHSHVHFDRLRESRFSDATLQVRLLLHQGTIYGTMAPVTDYDYGELEIVADEATLITRGERDRPLDLSTSFLIEARESVAAGISPFRAAAFRGFVEIRSAGEPVRLEGPEQYEIDQEGTGHRSQAIRSEILVNGAFVDGLSAWEVLYSAEAREPADRVGVAETMEESGAGEGSALHIYRDDSQIWARTGVRQEIHRTLRLPSDLTLTFDVMVMSQGDAIEGRETVPLAFELNYTDILGQERSWTTVYAVRDRHGVLNADSFTNVTPGVWTHVIVDLHNLEPIPKVLETLVVYSSGGGYDSFVANLSLTTGEGTSSP